MTIDSNFSEKRNTSQKQKFNSVQKLFRAIKALPRRVIVGLVFIVTTPKALYEERVTLIQMLFTHRANANEFVAEKYGKSKYWVFRALAAGSTKASDGLLIKLTRDDVPEVVEQVAWNSEGKPAVIEALSARLEANNLSEDSTSTINYSLRLNLRND